MHVRQHQHWYQHRRHGREHQHLRTLPRVSLPPELDKRLAYLKDTSGLTDETEFVATTAPPSSAKQPTSPQSFYQQPRRSYSMCVWQTPVPVEAWLSEVRL